MNLTRQTLHIFRKDIRAHWSEIATLILLNGLLVIGNTESWIAGVQRDDGPSTIGGAELTALISVLLAIAWCLLIVRVIHGETPASRSQYWLTRPYSKIGLLAAKSLFTLLFVHGLTTAAQLLILELSQVPYRMTDLALNQLMLLVVITLPVATIASLTRTQGQFLLIALPLTGIVLAALFATGFVGNPPEYGYYDSMLGPSSESFLPVRNLLWASVALPATAVVAMAGLIYQYLSRQTRSVAGFCGAGIVITALVIAALPDALASRMQAALIGTAEDYRVVRVGAPFEGTTTTGRLHEIDRTDDLQIAIPIDWTYEEARRLALVGLEAEIVSSSGRTHSVDSNNGWRLGLGFTGSGTPESLRSLLLIRIPRDIYQSIADDTIAIRFGFDLKEYATYRAAAIPTDGGSVQIDAAEQCGIGPYSYILCRRSFYGQFGPQVRGQALEVVTERPSGSAVAILRQAAAIPFRIDPIAATGRFRYRDDGQPIETLIRAPVSYAAGGLELTGIRLSDWPIVAAED